MNVFNRIVAVLVLLVLLAALLALAIVPFVVLGAVSTWANGSTQVLTDFARSSDALSGRARARFR